MQLSVLCLLLTISTYLTVAMKSKVVTTKTGNVQGVVEPSAIHGKYVQKFLNIPYAEPPVGKLRFRKPVPRKSWNETVDNNNISIACWQTLYYPSENIHLTEDCLILNIWTPYPQKTGLSVMVWIHGGSFKWGLAGAYRGNNIVAVGDVILVTINYRLSALGFLSSGDERIKGNFGLFDQRLAMKWVKENIDNFGGNPEAITIFGGSAGGASVSAHTLSKGSWPYFNRAILQSGGMNMPWATASRPVASHAFDVFLKAANCNNNEKMVECLQNNVTEDDFKRIYGLNSTILNTPWLAPFVDGDFFSDEPKMLLKNGRIKNDDVMLGVTKDEWFLGIWQLLGQSNDINFFTQKFEEVLKDHFKNASEEVYNKARQLYQSQNNFQSPVEAIRPIIDFQSDVYFLCSARSEANLRSKTLPSTNVYFYRYSYATPVVSEISLLYPNGTFGFAAHGLEVWSVFGWPINNTLYPFEDQVLSMRVILYWTNFAKNSNPNIGITTLPIVLKNVDNLPNWPRFTNSSREYLDMESSSRMLVKQRLRKKYCEFLSNPEEFTMATTVSPTTPEPTDGAIQLLAPFTVIVITWFNILKSL